MEARDCNYLFMKINIVIQYDDRMQDPPKIFKDFLVYFTCDGGLVTKYLIEQLKN